MRWKCKFCAFSSNGQGRILQHYKERHGHHRRCSGLVCIYEDCLNTFQTQAELKKHLKEHVKKDATFSQRRREIIGDEPLISAVVDRWPALFCERQVIMCQLSTA